jgi:hypothetical protein
MKKLILFFIFCVPMALFFYGAKAQSVAINTDGSVANNSAMLDIKSYSKGMLIPRTSTVSRTAIISPAKALLLYDTTTSSFWYHNGTAWIEISSGGQAWSITGNSGITDPLNFIGTLNSAPLNIRVNNEKSGRIESASPFITAFGYKTLSTVTTGTGNSAFGYQSLSLNTTGNFNTSMGVHAMLVNDSGIGNSAFGYESLLNNHLGAENTAIGNSALFANTIGSGNTATGSNSLYRNTTGSSNTATGTNALNQNNTGYQNTANGYGALAGNKTGYNNVGIGFLSLVNNTSGWQNTAVGNYSLYYDTSGANNTAVGFQALYYNANAIDNTAVGYQSMNANKTASWNTAIGSWSLPVDTTGANNTAAGYQSLYYNANGSENSAYGVNSLLTNHTGYQNTGIGNRALENSNTGYGNTAIGYHSLSINIDGSDNTALGESADVGSIALTNTTVIGAHSNVSTSNTMAFGSTTVNKWSFARSTVASGVLQVGFDGTNGNGAYLTAGGTWTNASDENQKDNITNLDDKDILDRISQLHISRWHYKGTKNEYHIGPMAQQFYALFKTGINNTSISSIDPAGIALLGIQALKKENDGLKQMINELKTEIEALRKK